jgi:hypothetical protein
MFANKIKINIGTVFSGSSGNNIMLPLTTSFQPVDQSELIDRVFVEVETEKAINPIIDYEKTRYTPIDSNNLPIEKIVYVLDFSGQTTYGQIGYSDDDIKYNKSNFTNSYLNLNFYDSDNPLIQNLVGNVTLFTQIKSSDLYQSGSTNVSIGNVLPASQIPVMFVLENPTVNRRGFGEGFHLYGYKDELNINESKYLYMRASYNNAKSGSSTNLMVKTTPQPIDLLVHELYTRYILTRTNDGFYYKIDDTYQGNSGVTGTNNVSYTTNTGYNTVTITLNQILAL